MSASSYHGRRAAQIENDLIRVTVTVEGGHVAEIFHKATRVNPLWLPPWPSIEPSSYDPAKHPEYGSDAESRLLSGILGHNICLDLFGPPSADEAAAGMTVHGEAPVAPYSVCPVERDPLALLFTTTLPQAQLRFERQVALTPTSNVVVFSETVENLSPWDRPVAWTQHVTLGPPFLERGQTAFRATATRSKVVEEPFDNDLGMQVTGAEFLWPFCPRKDGKQDDFRLFTSEPVSGGFTTHLIDPACEHAYFLAWSPTSKVVFGYVWNRGDFPWLGRWEENHLRTGAPWNGNALTCGMEFGVSPIAETRRQMIDRGSLFGVPGYRWIPARSRVSVRYCAFIGTCDGIPDSVEWDSASRIELK